MQLPKKKLRESYDRDLFQKQNLFYRNVRNEKDVDQPITITLEEYSALRLNNYIHKDVKKGRQALCAQEFNVSQPTFSRILKSGTEKLVQALVEERNFQIAGGNIGYKLNGWGCWNCNWESEIEERDDPLPKPVQCPKCRSKKLFQLKKIVTKWST